MTFVTEFARAFGLYRPASGSEEGASTGTKPAQRAKKNGVKHKQDHGRAAPIAKPNKTGRKLRFPELEPWPHPVGGAALLDDFVAAFRRYLSLPEGAAEVMALWVLFTHTFDAADVSPRLVFTSPVPECGKSIALSILGRLVPRPLLASNVTAPVIFRVIPRDHPTLLIDEADTYLHGDHGMKGILNSGHTPDAAFAWRCRENDYEPEGFSTWAPLAIAKIGRLHPTLHSRSIEIRMRRARRGEVPERFRPSKAGELDILARKAARWAGDNVDALRGADPAMPESIYGRTADNWRPLIGIADKIGGHWPKTARNVALRLSDREERDTSVGIQLLADIRKIFDEQGADRLPSEELCKALRRIDGGPWAGWKEFGLTQNQLAELLKPFEIKPHVIRVDDKTPRGYTRAGFEDDFSRYLPPESATPQQSNGINELEELSPATGGDDVADK